MSVADRIHCRLKQIEDRWTRFRRRRAARRTLRRFTPPYKLNVGCGGVRFEGWINIDADPQPGVADLAWDVRSPFPLPDGSCSHIYNEHFLEHLTVEEGSAFLRDCRRLLMPGGVLRIAMPDLRDWATQYVNNDWQGRPWLKKYGYEWIQTGAEMLNLQFRAWGHQWLYDFEEALRRLNDAGFGHVRSTAFGESEHADFVDRETRPESVLVIEASDTH